jgi:hypothetical protein
LKKDKELILIMQICREKLRRECVNFVISRLLTMTNLT